MGGAITISPPHRQRHEVTLEGAGRDLEGALGFLRARAVSGVEEVDGATYRRWLPLPRGHVVVALTLNGSDVELVLHGAHDDDLGIAVERCRALLDLDTDPETVDRALASDPALRSSVIQRPGIRVPGAVDGTELAVRAIVGQQISVARACAILGGLVTMYGEPLDSPVGAVTRTFPSAASLSAIDPQTLPMPRRRGASIVETCRRLATGALVLDPNPTGGYDAAALAATDVALQSIPGIGPWTAAYLAMRVLGDTDAFLPTDLGIRAGLGEAGLPTAARAATAYAERWRPWRAYASMHLWHLASGRHAARGSGSPAARAVRAARTARASTSQEPRS